MVAGPDSQRDRGAGTGGNRQNSSPENGLRILDRRSDRPGRWRLGVRIGPSLGLTFAALEVLTQLCGQSLLTLEGLGGFGHGDHHWGSLPIKAFWPCVEPRPMAVEPRRRATRPATIQCCRSSVVEHPLGKGEADSSILSGSTISSPSITLSSRKRPVPRRGLLCPRYLHVSTRYDPGTAMSGSKNIG